MANRYAVASTNWNLTSTWDNGATLGLPTSADDVYANGFTPVINQSITVQSLRNGAATGIAAGGGFSVTQSGLTIGGNIIGSGNGVILTIAVGNSGILTINGNLTYNSSAAIITPTSYSVLNINGTITAPTISNAFTNTRLAPNTNLAHTINIVGDILSAPTGGNSATYAIAYPPNASFICNLNITGNLNGNGTSGVIYTGNGGLTFNINITGNIIGGAYMGLDFQAGAASSTFTHTGNIYGSTSNYGIYLNAPITCSITGSCFASSYPAVWLNLSSSAIVTGPLVTSDATGAGAATAGQHAIWGRWYVADNCLTTFQYITRGATVSGSPLSRPARTLYLTDAYAASYPATSNVRSGTTYGAGNSLTGTCAVPPAGSVALGVPVDNTTGTAALTTANIQAALTAQGLTTARAAYLDNISTAPPSAASITTAVWAAATRTLTTTIPTASDIATAVWTTATSTLSTLGTIGKLLVDNINATISSRLASSSYTTPLDASGTRSALGLASANLDTQLAPLPNLDTTVSSRLATSSYTAPLDAAGTRTAVGLATANLDTQFNNIPANVRTNLATELGRIDTSISSRLPTTSYLAPLTASGTRSALGLASANLDTQLAPLPNLDTTVSSRLASASYTAPLDAAGTRTALGLASANLDAQFTDVPGNVWGVATSGLSTLGTIGKLLASNVDTTISSRLASSSYVAPLDAAGTRAAIGLTTANLDTQFSNIPANVRTNLSTELGRIDTIVSSRLASASYQAPLDAAGIRTAIGLATANLDNQLDSLPTAVENASAVRVELTPELNHIDADVSSRSTFNPSSDTVSHVTLVDTTTNLTNPPVVPTTTQIASAVRTELTPELNRIDVDTSSRLASADYTVPPTTGQNAQAVRTELTPELNYIDTNISSRLASADYTVPPSSQENAQAVRTELTPELTRIDANVTSRLAAADYTTPPTPEQNAQAVRAELTPELDRLANCATVDTTGQQIQNALST